MLRGSKFVRGVVVNEWSGVEPRGGFILVTDMKTKTRTKQEWHSTHDRRVVNEYYLYYSKLRLPVSEDDCGNDWFWGDALGGTTVYILFDSHDLKARTLAYTP